jgi:hypothetical protein
MRTISQKEQEQKKRRKGNMLKRVSSILILVPVLAGLCLATATTAQAQAGPPGGTIYAHDVAYRTVGTPTDLPPHGMFDTIYVLGPDLAAVSESAPGDQDYNGGRWEVRPIEWINIDPMQFTNAEDILAAADAGDIEIGDVVRRFVCPLIRK